MPTDLPYPDDVEHLRERVTERGGPVDVLINNATLGGVGAFLSMSHTVLSDHVNINLLAPMSLTRQVIPGMIERGRGAVVVVSSVAGEMATRNGTPYAATKAGLSLFANDLRRELKRLAMIGVR
jgi:short-subunit dehydrogenase